MGLTRIAVLRPLFITMVILAVVVFGLVSYGRLGVDLYPELNYPVVTVVTFYPGASPESVEGLVTIPIEDALSGLGDVDYMASTSAEGVSFVTLVFTDRARPEAAPIDVERKVNAIRANLPADAKPPGIVKADINALPVLNVALSGPLSIEELSRLADDRIIPRLNSVNGVASVALIGGRKREIQVSLNHDKLRAYGLSVFQVTGALAQENVNVPSGRLAEAEREYNVRLNALVPTPERLGSIVVAATPAGPVYLRDLAEVRDTTVKRTQINRSSGKDSIGLQITKQATANSLVVTDGVKKTIRALQPTLPDGVQLDVVTDASVFTRSSLNSLQQHLIEAVFLTGVVLLLFLHTWRSTIIVLLAIPTSLIATLAVMYFLGFTLNMMSMMGLALTVGILVDDSIVVLENIFRHLELGETPFTSAIQGRSEIGLAAMAITLVDVVVFVPIAFMSGIVGQYFRQFGLVVASATLFSLFVSFTLTPMLASRWLGRPRADDRSPLAMFGRAWESGYSWIARRYRSLLGWALRLRWLVVVVGLVSFAGGIALVAFNVVSTELMPEADQAEFTLFAEMPPGTALTITDQALATVEQRLVAWPEVQRTFTSVGVGGDNRPDQSRFGRIIVKLVPAPQRSQSAQELATEARRLGDDVPGLRLRAQLASVVGVAGQTVQIKLRGDDPRQLIALAKEVQTIVESVPGTRDVQNSGVEGDPEIVVRLDRARAADLGITAAQAASAARTAIAGSVVTQYRPEVGRAIDVRVLAGQDELTRVEQIRQLPLMTNRGTVVRLGQIATVELSAGLPQIDRRDRQPVVTVGADLAGRPLGDVVRDTQTRLDRLVIPPGYSIRFAGTVQAQDESFSQLYQALGLSILFMYMLMVALYESLLTPFVIMLSLPLSVVGAIGALALTGNQLSMVSMIGMIMLAGLVGKNAILLIDYTNTLRRQGKARDEALLVAGPTRLRPILMTTAAMVVAMLPVALGVDEGSELRAPMAIVLIGGLLTSTALTLAFIPAVYTIFDDAVALALRLLRRRPAARVTDDGSGEVALRTP
ncbi:MAG: efflux RND transporter permease subunit [Chloroflexi bacterium]|nr:efflux RND transporter permease subunit [Chloroflexota bacterium]